MVDSASTEAKAREYLRGRFEACYPFHPATLSVFQRKWQALAQYQQTRGTLAMLAQWGDVGAPCDFDGGGVGITDFLELLANWGPCQ